MMLPASPWLVALLFGVACLALTQGCAPSAVRSGGDEEQDTAVAGAEKPETKQDTSVEQDRSSGVDGKRAAPVESISDADQGLEEAVQEPPKLRSLLFDERAAAALETLAWRQYRSGNYAESSSSFEVLSTHFQDAWKYPFNAACAATLGNDLERAFLFLRIARGRAPAAVLKKAKSDADLAPLRASPNWQEWLDDDHKVEPEAGRTQAPSGSEHGGGTKPEPAVASPPVKQSVGEIRVETLDASFRRLRTSESRVGLIFDVALELTGENASQVNATALCKIGDDYVWGWSANADPRSGVVLRKADKLSTHASLSVLTSSHCPANLSLDACTVVVHRKDGTKRTPIAEFCTHGEGRATAGPCLGVAPTATGLSVDFEITSVAIDSSQRPLSLEVCSTARAGSQPSPRMIQMEVTCKSRKGSFRDTSLVTHPLTDPPAGSVTREWDFFNLKGTPSSCRFRYLSFDTEQQLPGTQTYCYDGSSGSVSVCAQDAETSPKGD